MNLLNCFQAKFYQIFFIKIRNAAPVLIAYKLFANVEVLVQSKYAADKKVAMESYNSKNYMLFSFKVSFSFTASFFYYKLFKTA